MIPDTKQTRAMRKLGYSDAQIEEMLEDDKVVDQGGTLPWDMSKEEHKKAMKNANATEHKKPTVYDFSKRERKENPTKAGIVAELAKFLEENSEYATENVAITNKERQISFQIGEEKYELTLVQKRKPKT